MENLIVYQSIREHILQKETEVTNELTYMYVTYFGLLVSGAIWSSWLSLVSFIDLIVFQAMINRSQLSITKATMYIQIFFEEKRGIYIGSPCIRILNFYLLIIKSMEI